MRPPRSLMVKYDEKKALTFWPLIEQDVCDSFGVN